MFSPLDSQLNLFSYYVHSNVVQFLILKKTFYPSSNSLLFFFFFFCLFFQWNLQSSPETNFFGCIKALLFKIKLWLPPWNYGRNLVIFYFIFLWEIWQNLPIFPSQKILSQMAKFCHTKKVADVDRINIFPGIPECKYLDKYIHYPINNIFF
jgi:hypothetical protein